MGVDMRNGGNITRGGGDTEITGQMGISESLKTKSKARRENLKPGDKHTAKGVLRD